MLRTLHVTDTGPAARVDLSFGERLNVLTGDNGLGKSFVLDVAFWALTGTWADRPVLPRRGKEDSAEISGEMENGNEGPLVPQFHARFDRVSQRWDDRFHRPSVSMISNPETQVRTPEWLPGLAPVLYVRPDGLFTLWDPARLTAFADERPGPVLAPPVYRFTPSDLWDGLQHKGKAVCNGLIQDWITWQLEAEGGQPEPFSLLREVLAKLSDPEEPMRPGKPVKLYLDDVRKFPTIDLAYGNVPVTHASAGMKRILGLAYLLTWMWTEHLQAAQMIGRKPAERLVLLVDEPEAHLHPKWQRHIVPALLDVASHIGPGVRPQILLTTHAPLVLASLETRFDARTDRLFGFDMKDGSVFVDELPWAKQGDATGWLTSRVFGLYRGYSVEADQAMQAAYDFLAGKRDRLPAGLDSEEAIQKALERSLPDQDPFWPTTGARS